MPIKRILTFAMESPLAELRRNMTQKSQTGVLELPRNPQCDRYENAMILFRDRLFEYCSSCEVL